jgi:hypothetical protein
MQACIWRGVKSSRKLVCVKRHQASSYWFWYWSI